MRNYAIRRTIETFVVIQLLLLLSYFMLTRMPGDPIDQMITANPKITTEDIARLKQLHGLDQPFYRRYAGWYWNLITLKLGYSRKYKVPVKQLMGPCLLNTFILSASAFLLAAGAAIPIGVWAAIRRKGVVDYSANALAFLGISIPSFFLGILLIIIFAVWLQWLPAGGTEDPGVTGWARVWSRLEHLVLPVFALAAMQAAILVRYTRSSMLEVLKQDYIRTARAKGLGRFQVIVKHGLRNALLPVITVLALHIGTLFSGAVITETVFAYQGVGKLVYDSIIANDFNVAMMAFTITISMVLVMNLAADLLYGVLDPRISHR